MIIKSGYGYTIGIFGSWGSGKTTLMELICRKINIGENIKY